MKALYDWLKEFADLTLSPEELRARLSLAGIAVEGLAQTSAGPLLDTDLTINRPDCLGHYGLAREAATLERKRVRPDGSEAEGSGRGRRQSDARRDRMSRAVRALHGARAARREDRAVASEAAAAPGSAGAGFHQQRRRRDQLRDAGAGPAHARIRFRSPGRATHRRAQGAQGREDAHAGRRRARRWRRRCA